MDILTCLLIVLIFLTTLTVQIPLQVTTNQTTQIIQMKLENFGKFGTIFHTMKTNKNSNYSNFMGVIAIVLMYIKHLQMGTFVRPIKIRRVHGEEIDIIQLL